jgi:hypothetical protein
VPLLVDVVQSSDGLAVKVARLPGTRKSGRIIFRVLTLDTEDAMPTLFRLLVAIAFVAGLAYAGMFALAVLVEPNERDVTVRVPTRDLLVDAP